MNWKDDLPKENIYYETDNGILYNVDSFDFIKELPNDFIDMVITSPPYLKLQKYNKNINWLENEKEYIKKITELSKNIYKILNDNGSFLLNIGDKKINKRLSFYPLKTVISISEQTKLKLYENLIWDKISSPPRPNSFINLYEYIFVFVKDLKKFYINIDNMRIPYTEVSKKRMQYSTKNSFSSETTEERNKKKDKFLIPNKKGGLPKNILRFAPQKGKKPGENYHTATFPYHLIEYLIKGFSKEKDIIFDPFMGSGTVALMAENNNRRWIGFEIDKSYCEIIKKRIISEKKYKLF